MKKKYSLSVIAFLICMLSLKAQIYTPNGSIQGISVNDNVGIGTDQTNAKLTIKAGPDGNPTPLKAISIWGPNSPANSNSAQDLSWDFAAAGSASIRSFRGGSWDTYMQFLTNNSLGGNDPKVRMHIDFMGNIGIGTTDPTSKLDVLGTIKSYETSPLGASLNSYKLINDRGGNVGENTVMNRLWFLRDANLNNWFSARLHDGISVDVSFAIPHVDTRTWWERDPLDNIQSWGNAAETYLTINAGNIGIGTTAPTSKLDVVGTIKSYETSPLEPIVKSYKIINDRGGNVGENSVMNRLWLLRDASLNNWYSARLHDGISVDVSFAIPHVDTRTWWERDPLDNIQSWGNASETYFTINAGNVGIGTTTPDEKLTVKGKIHTQEVRVDMLGSLVPDYVFANDYKLKTLQDVEEYINKNNHLPEIPSAAELEKNGLMLAEMNMTLLKKIEEMTLYMIEQNKQLQMQNKKITILENKIEIFTK